MLTRKIRSWNGVLERGLKAHRKHGRCITVGHCSHFCQTRIVSFDAPTRPLTDVAGHLFWTFRLVWTTVLPSATPDQDPLTILYQTAVALRTENQTLNSILQKIVHHKRSEIDDARRTIPEEELIAAAKDAPAARDFVAPLRRASQSDSIGLIAEVKKASPSKGIIREDFDPVSIARQYAAHGASCISVLTDVHFFQGSLDYLKAIRQSVETPLLRKDFILEPYQVYEARAAGADAVLLIAECLRADKLKSLYDLITGLGMTALVELYDKANVENVLACQPVLVGVNNRDLNTFEVDLNHSIGVRQAFDAAVTFVSESGIETHADVQRLKSANVDAMLIGETLMRSADIGTAIRELLA